MPNRRAFGTSTGVPMAHLKNLFDLSPTSGPKIGGDATSNVCHDLMCVAVSC